MDDYFRNLIVGPRPQFRKLRQMAAEYNLVMTLLKPAERAEELGRQVQKVGLQWDWFPLDARPYADPSPSPNWMEAAFVLHAHLNRGTLVYLHCAAGIHRTGMVIYLTYRVRGWAPERCEAAVFHHRPDAKGQCSDKLRWAELIYSDYLHQEGTCKAST